jgi:hypothetical protein
MANNFPPVDKIFDDLDKFRDYCRFEGKPFDEADLYKKDSWVWQAYQKYLNYLRAKARGSERKTENLKRKFNTGRY